MAAKLTKTYVDRVKPGPKDEFHWDSEVSGFALKVTPRGKLTFIVQGRVAHTGKEARLTIGTFGVFTVEQARDAAREHLRTMRLGADPRELKRQEAATQITLAEVSNAYVNRPGKLKDSSKQTIERHVATTFDGWKDKPVISITESMCRTRYNEILTKGLRGDRENGSPGQANQAFAILSALLNYAARQHKKSDGTPLIPFNPVDGLKDHRARLKPRTRRIIDTRIGTVWQSIHDWRALAAQRDTATAIDMVSFLMLTGLRLTEASSLRWNQIFLDDGYFHLPNPKNGNAVSMPLSRQALALLSDRHGLDDSPYVFASSDADTHMKDPRALWQRLSKVAGNTISAHDLRRSYTNIALRQCRIEKFRVDLLTNHVSSDVTSVHYFDTTNLQWLQPEAQMIADYLDREAAIAAGANVVALHPAGAA